MGKKNATKGQSINSLDGMSLVMECIVLIRFVIVCYDAKGTKVGEVISLFEDSLPTVNRTIAQHNCGSSVRATPFSTPVCNVRERQVIFSDHSPRQRSTYALMRVNFNRNKRRTVRK